MGHPIKIHDDTKERLDRVKEKYGLASYNDAIRFLLDRFEEYERIVDRISKIDKVLRVVKVIDELLNLVEEEHVLEAIIMIAEAGRKWKSVKG